ncbi:peptidoglycan DD-metalloendopeptidase family protein [bacterium]|nr:peptidoglycan DD-metalloendopeptidase family protein [bacterium]
MKVRKYPWIFFLLVFLILPLHRVFGDNESRRTRLQQQIQGFQADVARQKQQEATALQYLNKIEMQVVISRQIIHELRTETLQKKKAIAQIEKQLISLTDELALLREKYARRLVDYYKHGQQRDLEVFLSVKSFNQVMVWLKYQKVLVENDQRNILRIVSKKNTIQVQRSNLQDLWAENRKLLTEKNNEEAQFKKKRSQRHRLLKNIRKDKKLTLQKIKEAQTSLAEIEQLISGEEEQRRLGQSMQKIPAYHDFHELRGRMLWPVQGKVIKQFGKYRHPQLKTITQNLGVDIFSQSGQPVLAVAQGVVSQIKWMRGIGTLVLLNQGKGYYTVYANLGEVFINQNDDVQIGQPIGTVGDAGIEQQNRLHFEIWKKNEAQNPTRWLRN